MFLGPGVIHYNFPGFTLEKFFAFCHEQGVKYVELSSSDIIVEGEDTAKNISKVSGFLETFGVEISQITARNDFLQPTEEEWNAQIVKIVEAAKVARAFGTELLRIDGGWEKPGVEKKDYDRLITDGLKSALKATEPYGVKFALDNHGVVTNDYLYQLDLFSRIASERLGANLDTMNYRWFGYPVEKLPEIFHAIAPYTLHTHLKDGFGSREGYRGAALGRGEIPLDIALDELAAVGYEGVLCAEYEGKELEDGVGYAQCVEWIKNKL
ncbi:MAG: sugar phosphate isomerase/epimerase family protein [Candidatus Ratteibacteria bacterium]|jgi:sugar phosphate isomerase/epimerase